MFDSTTVEGQFQTQFPQYSYRLKKISLHYAGFENSEGLHLPEFRLKNDKWDQKGQARIGYFRQKILDSCKFISDTVLQKTASSTAIFFLQPAEYKLVSQLMVYTLSGFYFLCFHFPCFWQDWREREREKPRFLCMALLFSFFPRRGFTAILFHTGFCSATRNWRELYKNLSVMSSLGAYTQNQIQQKELTSFRRVGILNIS